MGDEQAEEDEATCNQIGSSIRTNPIRESWLRNANGWVVSTKKGLQGNGTKIHMVMMARKRVKGTVYIQKERQLASAVARGLLITTKSPNQLAPMAGSAETLPLRRH